MFRLLCVQTGHRTFFHLAILKTYKRLRWLKLVYCCLHTVMSVTNLRSSQHDSQAWVQVRAWPQAARLQYQKKATAAREQHRAGALSNAPALGATSGLSIWTTPWTIWRSTIDSVANDLLWIHPEANKLISLLLEK